MSDIADSHSSARLTEDLWAAVALTEDGARVLWLMRRGADDQQAGCACRCCAPHEQTGPLPRPVAQALGLTCPAIKSDGKRCRMVTRTGEFCQWHRGGAR